MKSLLIILTFVSLLSGCATPYLDRLMYEDQLNANKRNYLLYREDREWANQDKINKGLPPEPVLTREEWQKTQAPDKYVENYERKHGITK